VSAKQVYTTFLLAALCLGIFTGCQHEHEWQDATCTVPKTCTECGATDGAALGHTWTEATCLKPSECTECGEKKGEALGHDWIEATCTEPETCLNCEATKGQPLAHDWIEATCTAPETCAVCRTTKGSASGHDVENWEVVEVATCSTEGIETGVCTVCNETVERRISKEEHIPGEWEIVEMPTENSKGTRGKYCSICGTKLEDERFSLSEEELEQLYKDSCQSISYDSLARTPDEYEGERVKFTGKVVQVCSEATSLLYYSTYRVATSSGWDDVVYIFVDNYGSGSRILEDDWITFYGEFDGLYTYETVLGSSITIPSVEVMYID